ncbi:MAG TPA: secretin N-terminal domain-containing protein [Candidatus Dormibacteraeota bacterium]|nr:secretin N-terminal domain-containing protein [Candidatus Dormibacteraeota bacterium]
MHRFFCNAALMLAAATTFSGQVVSDPAAPVRPAAKGTAGTAGRTAPADANDPGVTLQFPNSDVADVLRFYEQLTGKKLVMDNFVQGKVNIFIAKAVSRDEAIKIIEMSMALNGISLIPAAPDIIEVVGAGQNPRKAVVPIISDLTDIPGGNPVISFLFKLQYADPQELQQVLMAYFQGSSGSINILALPKSSSLLVTQNADVVRQLASVIAQIDVAPAEVVSEFIKLERADAGKVVDMLKDIFEKGTQTSTQPGVRSVRVPPNVPQPMPVENETGAMAGLSEEAVVVGKIKLTADVRTNRIHVVTRPINMPFIRKLIREFDANVEFAKPVTRYLQYISSGDVLPVLVQALTEPGTEGAGAVPGGGLPGASPQPQQQQQQRGGFGTTGTTGTTNPYTSQFGGTSSTAGGSTLNISEQLSTQPVNTTPQAVTVGTTKLIADQRANSIIVLGNREVVVKVEKILDQMDVQAPQVALSTVIGQLTLSNNEEFGADYFAKYGKRFVGTSNNGSVFGNNAPAIPVPVPNASASPITANTANILDPSNLINFSQIIQNVGNGTNIYAAAGNAFAAIVHLLESTNKFKILSRPTVFTSNNKKAIIASGQEVPVPVNTLSNAATVGTVASVSSSIEYKQVVLQLEVVPLINSEKEVSLDILQKLDSLVPNGIVNISGNQVPIIDTKYIRTNVSAANGSTIILGGLIQEQKQKQYTGIPYISRIPLIGAAFRGTATSKQRQELIILMCPQVTLTKLDQYRLRQRWENVNTHFGPELDESECPDCPKTRDGKQLTLPPPDIPESKDMK